MKLVVMSPARWWGLGWRTRWWLRLRRGVRVRIDPQVSDDYYYVLDPKYIHYRPLS